MPDSPKSNIRVNMFAFLMSPKRGDIARIPSKGRNQGDYMPWETPLGFMEEERESLKKDDDQMLVRNQIASDPMKFIASLTDENLRRCYIATNLEIGWSERALAKVLDKLTNNLGVRSSAGLRKVCASREESNEILKLNGRKVFLNGTYSILERHLNRKRLSNQKESNRLEKKTQLEMELEKANVFQPQIPPSPSLPPRYLKPQILNKVLRSSANKIVGQCATELVLAHAESRRVFSFLAPLNIGELDSSDEELEKEIYAIEKHMREAERRDVIMISNEVDKKNDKKRDDRKTNYEAGEQKKVVGYDLKGKSKIFFRKTRFDEDKAAKVRSEFEEIRQKEELNKFNRFQILGKMQALRKRIKAEQKEDDKKPGGYILSDSLEGDLLSAVLNNDIVRARRILEAKANPNILVHGTTPLHAALGAENSEFHGGGAKNDAKNAKKGLMSKRSESSYQSTKLRNQIVTEAGNNIRLIKLLIDYQASPFIRDSSKGTVLDHAIACGAYMPELFFLASGSFVLNSDPVVASSGVVVPTVKTGKQDSSAASNLGMSMPVSNNSVTSTSTKAGDGVVVIPSVVDSSNVADMVKLSQDGSSELIKILVPPDEVSDKLLDPDLREFVEKIRATVQIAKTEISKKNTTENSKKGGNSTTVDYNGFGETPTKFMSTSIRFLGKNPRAKLENQKKTRPDVGKRKTQFQEQRSMSGNFNARNNSPLLGNTVGADIEKKNADIRKNRVDVSKVYDEFGDKNYTSSPIQDYDINSWSEEMLLDYGKATYALRKLQLSPLLVDAQTRDSALHRVQVPEVLDCMLDFLITHDILEHDEDGSESTLLSNLCSNVDAAGNTFLHTIITVPDMVDEDDDAHAALAREELVGESCLDLLKSAKSTLPEEVLTPLINRCNGKGNTVLLEYIHEGVRITKPNFVEPIVRLLLDCKARTDVLDAQGHTVLHLCLLEIGKAHIDHHDDGKAHHDGTNHGTDHHDSTSTSEAVMGKRVHKKKKKGRTHRAIIDLVQESKIYDWHILKKLYEPGPSGDPRLAEEIAESLLKDHAGEGLRNLGMLDDLFNPYERQDPEIKKEYDFLRRQVYRSIIGPLRKRNRELKVGKHSIRLLEMLLEITRGPLGRFTSMKGHVIKKSDKRSDMKSDIRGGYRRIFERDLRQAYGVFKKHCDTVFTQFKEDPVGGEVCELPRVVYVSDPYDPDFSTLLSTVDGEEAERRAKLELNHFLITFQDLPYILKSENQIEIWKLWAKWGVIRNIDELARLTHLGAHRWFSCSRHYCYNALGTSESQCQAATPLLLMGAAIQANPFFQSFVKKHFPPKPVETSSNKTEMIGINCVGYNEGPIKSYGRILRKTYELVTLMQDDDAGQLDFIANLGKNPSSTQKISAESFMDGPERGSVRFSQFGGMENLPGERGGHPTGLGDRQGTRSSIGAERSSISVGNFRKSVVSGVGRESSTMDIGNLGGGKNEGRVKKEIEFWMSSAFVTDYVRCSVVFETPSELKKGMEKIESWRLDTDGVQFVQRQNGLSRYHRAGTLGFRDIKYLVRFLVPPSTRKTASRLDLSKSTADLSKSAVTTHEFEFLGEIVVSFAPYLEIKNSMMIEYNIERGDYDTLPRTEIATYVQKMLQSNVMYEQDTDDENWWKKRNSNEDEHTHDPHRSAV